MENTEQKKPGFDFNSMDNTTKITAGLSLVGVIGCFLPFLTVSVMGHSASANLFDAGGILIYLVFVGFLVSLITPFAGDQLKSMGSAASYAGPKYATIVACAALLIQTLVEFSGNAAKMVKAAGGSLNLGIGWFLMMGAGIVIILIQFKVIKIK